MRKKHKKIGLQHSFASFGHSGGRETGPCSMVRHLCSKDEKLLRLFALVLG